MILEILNFHTRFTLLHLYMEILGAATNQYSMHILSLVTDNNPFLELAKVRRITINYFMIKLPERMGPALGPLY